MKSTFLLLIFILNSGTFLLAQSDKKEVPSERIIGENIKPFIDSLKQRILLDTIKFNRKNLKHINGRTENRNPYSLL
jgi:hypothetical protein